MDFYGEKWILKIQTCNRSEVLKVPLTCKIAVPFLKLEKDLMISWFMFSIVDFQCIAKSRIICSICPKFKKVRFTMLK